MCGPTHNCLAFSLVLDPAQDTISFKVYIVETLGLRASGWVHGFKGISLNHLPSHLAQGSVVIHSFLDEGLIPCPSGGKLAYTSRTRLLILV